MYNNYIFDLYGTLVDIKTDEEQDYLWEKMAMIYSYIGASYTSVELKEAYHKIVKMEENMLIENNEKSMAEEMIDFKFINYISNTNNNDVTNNFELMSISESEEKKEKMAYDGYPEIQIENVFRKLYLHKGIEVSLEECVYTARFFRAISTKYIKLYDGAKELLMDLKARKKKVYLLSNAQKVFTEHELKMLDIYNLFDGVFISSDYLCKKPDHRFFNILINKYGLRPEDTLMIGNDPTNDIQGAAEVGLDTFYIQSNLSPKLGRGKRVKSTFYLKDNTLSKVMKIIENGQ